MKLFLIILAWVFIFLSVGNANDLVEKVRTTLPKVQTAVVPVKLVIKMKMRKQEQERKVEVTGTIIDSSGLVVVSALSIDPAAAYNAFQADGARASTKSAIDSDISETTIILADGTEVDADVVLKDVDLDLAFIRPKESTRKFDSVALPNSPRPIQILDDIFVINRLGPTEDRTPIVAIGKVRSIVKGPRTYYICDDDISKNLGCIVFASDGMPVGIFVAKKSHTSGAFSSGFSSIPISVMRPIEDVLDVAAQAKDAKLPEKRSVSVEEGAKEVKTTAEPVKE